MKISKVLLVLSLFLLFKFNLAFAKTFEDINVSGNKRISLNSIIVLGKIDKDADYSDSDLNEIIKNLYETSFFKNISISIANNVLNVTVIENPIIEDLKIIGIKNKKLLEFFESSLFLKSRKSFSEFYASQDLATLKNVSKSLGYYFADITYSFEENKVQNTVQLSYNFNLGEKAKIKKIIFLGDKKFKDKTLKELVISEEHKFWKFLSTNVYLNPEQINLDQRLLLNYYKDNGYYNATIDNSFAELNTNGNFNLIFNINSGKKYFFNKFSLNIPEDFDETVFEPINEIFLKLENKHYSLRKIDSIINKIDKIATSRLYEFIDATIEETIIDEDKINFDINVSETEKFYVDRINILGNYNTVEEVIRHKLIVDEGDPFNEILFNKSINNIKALNIFKSVDTEITDNKNLNLKSINIIVDEKPTGEISLGAGVGSSGGTIGGGIKENNFLGKGISLDTNIAIQESGVKGRFIYSKPNFNYSDNDLTTSVVAQTTDKLKANGYKNSNIGFDVGTRFEQYENLYFSPEISFLLEDLETNATASNQLRRQQGVYKDVYFNYGLNYDLRDRSYRPTDGYNISFHQNIPMVSDNYELINSFEINKYQTLSQRSNVIGKISFFTQALNSINGNNARISKRLFIPSKKLRGFEPGKVGPIDNSDYIGGNYVTGINMSSTLPSIFPTFENIDLSIFLDAANVWGIDYSDTVNEQNKIRSATGLSVDLITPVGPLNFSFSQPISKASTDKTESFRFNLGTTF
jgi:outer membrane protein insertion porin family